MIMSFKVTDLDSTASKYINDKVKTKEEAIIGASYIIAEWISDNAYYRKWIRSYFYKNGIIVCKNPELMREKAYRYGITGIDFVSYASYLPNERYNDKPVYIDEIVDALATADQAAKLSAQEADN